MKFTKKEEWESYLLEELKECSSGGYVIVAYDDITELIYFSKHIHEGTPWLLEAPNYLRTINIENDEHADVLIEYGFTVIGNLAYEVDTPQCSPFLPDRIEIVGILGEGEEKVIDYFLTRK